MAHLGVHDGAVVETVQAPRGEAEHLDEEVVGRLYVLVDEHGDDGGLEVVSLVVVIAPLCRGGRPGVLYKPDLGHGAGAGGEGARRHARQRDEVAVRWDWS